MDILKWLHKRCVRREGGFNALEGWAVKEIGGEIEVPAENLINPISPTPQKAISTTHNNPTTTLTVPTTTPRDSAFRGTTNANAISKVDTAADSVSLRASVLSRNTTKRSVTPSPIEQSLNMNTGLSLSVSLVRSAVSMMSTNPNPVTLTYVLWNSQASRYTGSH